MKSWLAICGVLGGGAALVAAVSGFAGPWAPLGEHLLAWSRYSWTREPWTLWTSAWVHSAGGNFTGNVLALLALAIVGAALQVGRASALALLAAWPLAVLGLLAWTRLPGYHGLGAALHAAAMVLWAHTVFRPDLKPVATVLFFAMALKLVVEKAWVVPMAFDPGWGFNVVYAAHLSGAAAGTLCGLVAEATARGPGLRSP